MGTHNVIGVKNQSKMQGFSQALMRDIQAMEYMLENNWFENDIMRIGAEQELCIVDAQSMRPAPINGEILNKMSQYNWIKPELAKYNLETNLTPYQLTGDCLNQIESEGKKYISQLRKVAHSLGADIVMAGILPTLKRYDLQMENLTANKRYLPLLNATKDLLLGAPFTFHIRGIDELILQSHSTLFPGSCTSFQVHLQIPSHEFAKYYNIAQAITPYILAISANSPIVFGKRLWHETRMILYPQGSDTRLPQNYLRKFKPRASFGDIWLNDSILELYKDDISRYRILLGGEVKEDALEKVKNGETPTLEALQIHNSTVYRWNRPCYGISQNGKPHLRIENRVISAGPTVMDETANAAFWIGLMTGMANSVDDIRDFISFSTVKENFERASKFSIQSELLWLDGKSWSANQLILEKLIPIARKGLETHGILKENIDRYLGIIEARATSKINGATWALKAYSSLREKMTETEALTTLTSYMVKNQNEERPVHTWEAPKTSDVKTYNYSLCKVEEIMQTDLISVLDDCTPEFAANIMKWNKATCLAVEDEIGFFTGLVYEYDIKRLQQSCFPPTINSVIDKAPIKIGPEAEIMQAWLLIQKKQIQYLPVVKHQKLVGFLTKDDFPEYAKNLFGNRFKTKQ